MKMLRSQKTGKCLTKFDLVFALHHNSTMDHYKSLVYYLYPDLFSYQEIADKCIEFNAIV